MGLDMRALRKLERIEEKDENDERDKGNHTVRVWESRHFPGRHRPLEPGWYRGEPMMFGPFPFKSLGAYREYGMFREFLAIVGGYEKHPTPQESPEHPHACTAWQAHEGPFWELINFFDNEGVLGPDACMKLSEDFRAHSVIASKVSIDLDRTDFAETYSVLWRMFAFAADGGVVELC